MQIALRHSFHRTAIAAIASLAALSAGHAAEPTQYPLTLENCGRTITFEAAPQRAVTIGQGGTEILLSLGLADRMAGTSVWVGPVLEQYEAENAKVRRLADDYPSFEAVVAQAPELVTVQFEWHVGEGGAVASREQFAELGIPTYVSPSDCAAKDNKVGGDGIRIERFSMELVYQEIRELAEIFDVNERGETLVAELKAREEEAKALVSGIADDDVSVVFWFSSPEVQGDAFVAGRNGAPAYMLSVLGARNVITTEEEWPLVSWETLATLNPTVIVIAEMERRRYGADDPAVKLRFLETDPVTSALEAVEKKRFVMMDAQSMNPTIRTIDGLEALANGIKSFGLVD